jgi:Flp pilus assembly CpaF family ATPase
MAEDERETPQPPDPSAAPADAPLGRFVMGRGGGRAYSLGALVERIADQFRLEHGGAADEPLSPALAEADTSARRMALIIETAGYIFAIESVSLTGQERALVLEGAYSELFGYGPLDPWLLDPHITSVLLRGSGKASVRYGHGELRPVGRLFDDDAHMRAIVDRLLADADAPLSDETDILETGLTVGQRTARLTVVPPSLAFEMTADLRLHPPILPTLEALVEADYMPVDALNLIRTILRSRYGFAIVGEPETGKTVLLNAIVGEYAAALGAGSAGASGERGGIAVVQRAEEMRLPDGVRGLAAVWPTETRAAVSFGEQITNALITEPDLLVLDEVRADEPFTIAPLLSEPNAPRQIWSVRGAPDSKRLQSALGMLARRSAFGEGERLVHALYERLPFVITLARIRDRLQVFSIAEWQSRIDTDYPDYVLLMRYEEGCVRPTGARSARWIDAG